ncbi:uncharacterized protein LOC107413781 [Ziziphus jujuba]|uniref:Uncharacterized protein LOC107413781 n=1 Tax=Ziziphus jujuba TaxID=326968 RepID=A0A6P3ZE55_ZIZJJ|nr:uncharacterized protein LOC107413781 [Ziziphus jujuba]
MRSEQIAKHIDDAEIYHGEAICKQKSRQLLQDMSLPQGLLPLNDVVEFGFNRTSGFVWLRQKTTKEHQFRAIGRSVSYDTEVMAFVEERRLRRLTGVKSKELLIWVTISDIIVNDSDPTKITFSNPTGISKTFPASAFELDDDDNGAARRK